MKAFARFFCVLSLTAFCVACGGGGGAAPPPAGGGGAAPPPPPPPPPPVSTGPELFSLSRDSATLFKIDPESGASLDSLVITLPGQSLRGGRGLAASPVTQQLFAVLQFQTDAHSKRLLATIDPVSGMATQITTDAERTASLAFDNPGTPYGGMAANAGHDFFNKLYVFDTVTGQRTEFMNIANSEGGLALALNPLDGHIYHLSGSLCFGCPAAPPRS